MRPIAALAVIAFAVAPPLGAQAVVDPGMTRSQVVEKLGRPAVERQSGTATFLYYRNGAEKVVGMSDIVVLEQDKVVDAVFRSAARKYSGTSSSPAAIPAEVARKHPQVAEPRGPPMRVPEAAAASAPAAGGSMKAASRMPAQEANTAKAVEPTKQARSAMLEQQNSAKAADSAKAAKAGPARADSAKAAKKP